MARALGAHSVKLSEPPWLPKLPFVGLGPWSLVPPHLAPRCTLFTRPRYRAAVWSLTCSHFGPSPSTLVTHLCPGVSAIANPQLPFFHSRSYSYSHPSIHYSLLSLFNTTEIVSTCFYLDLKTNPRWLVSLRLFVTSRHVSLDRGYTTPATDTPHAICMDSYVWFSSS